MEDYTWQKCKYMLLKGRWGIAIWIEAGYLMTFDILPYFCDGLKMASKYLYEFLPEGMHLIIALRSIQFSECYVQIEGFTALPSNGPARHSAFPCRG